MEIFNIHAAKTHFSQIVERALAGEEIVIARNGEALLDLVPRKSHKVKKSRQGGQWTGKIWYAPDYDQADAMIQKMFDESEIFPKD